MKNKFICIIILIICALLTGCSHVDPDAIVSIAMDESTIPSSIELQEVKDAIKGFALVVTYGDGSTDLIQFNKNMISEEDFAKFYQEGTHIITVNYMDLQTVFEVTIYKKIIYYYTVKVMYPDNTPLNNETVVRWYRNSEFYRTSTLDEQGITQLEVDSNEYLIRLASIPEGYTYNPNIYIINNENRTVEIILQPLQEVSEGDGTSSSPISLKEGYSYLTFELNSIAGMKYFSFTPETSGKYYIESIAESIYPSNATDPYLGFLGETKDILNMDTSGNKESHINVNFKYEFEAEAGKTYYFVIFLSLANQLPASFLVNISK